MPLKDISYTLQDIEDSIDYGFSALKDTINYGFSALGEEVYQLHLDNVGTQAILNDILSCLLDKEAFKRELEYRRRQKEDQYRYLQASNQYSDAMKLTQRAIVEKDMGKAGAMLDEAMILFERANTQQEFHLQANFQLGYLYQIHKGNLETDILYYCRSIGEPYSSHNVRVARHLAHLYYCKEDYKKAFECMSDFVKHMEDIETFAVDLSKVYKQSWPVCIDALEQTLQKHTPLLRRCSKINSIQSLLHNERRFTATENFKESYSEIMVQLQEIKPDLRVLFDGARYATKIGNNKIAKNWLEKMYNYLPSNNAKRVILLEAMACEDFDNA